MLDGSEVRVLLGKLFDGCQSGVLLPFRVAREMLFESIEPRFKGVVRARVFLGGLTATKTPEVNAVLLRQLLDRGL